MTNAIKDFYVGQKLIYVESQSRNPKPIDYEVTGIGNKWITVKLVGAYGDWSTKRFLPKDMQADGGKYCSPGSFYLYLTDYENSIKQSKLFSDLRTTVSGMYSLPKHLTIEKLEMIIKEIKGV